MTSSAFQRAVAWVLVTLLVYFLYRIFAAFLVPLAWAVVLAVFFSPLHRRILQRIQRPGAAALLTLVCVIILLLGPAVWLVPAVVKQGVTLFSTLADAEQLKRAIAFLQYYVAHLPEPLSRVQEAIQHASQAALGALAQGSARLAGDVAALLLDLFVMLFSMYYLFRDGALLVGLLRDISPLAGEQHDVMMAEVTDLIQATISSGFVVAATQGFLGGLLLWIFGFPSPAFWGVIMAVLAFLPLVGTGLVWAPAGVWLIIQGSVFQGILMLVLGFAVVGGVDNFLRPMLIAGRSQLNGLLVFFGLLGGVNAFGFLGIILGPLVVATAVGLLRGYRESLQDLRKREAPGRGDSAVLRQST